MELAGKGLPATGGVGYEIFDKGDAFSSTSFVQNLNHLRALEGELSRTIRTVTRVASARVHLAIPERRLFERDKEPPRASIVMRLRGELGAEQIQAIRHLVASAVEGLVPEHVSIVDERGRLLADGAGSDGAGLLSAGEDRRIALERRLRGQVEEIVAGIVGAGRARIQVTAELETSRVESRSESFDPESRVVRSTQTRGENSATNNSEGQVSVGTELPGAKDANPDKANGNKDVAAKNEEVINYEISRTTRTEIQQAGRLKRISVAVLVDGSYAKGPAGEPSYQPRTKEDLDRIGALVRTAVGFDKGRGDQVEVVNLPFAPQPGADEAEAPSLLASIFNPSKDDVMRWAELAVMSLLCLIVLMVVVRPMVKRVLAPEALLPAAGGKLAIASGGTAALTDASATSPEERERAERNEVVAAMAAAQMARLTDLSKTQPKQAAAILRSWMNAA